MYMPVVRDVRSFLISLVAFQGILEALDFQQLVHVKGMNGVFSDEARRASVVSVSIERWRMTAVEVIVAICTFAAENG